MSEVEVSCNLVYLLLKLDTSFNKIQKCASSFQYSALHKIGSIFVVGDKHLKRKSFNSQQPSFDRTIFVRFNCRLWLFVRFSSINILVLHCSLIDKLIYVDCGMRARIKASFSLFDRDQVLRKRSYDTPNCSLDLCGRV